MFVSLDLETTGLDKRKNQITEFGAIKFDLEGNQETFQTFINPGGKIPEFITHITNITDEDIADAPKLEEVQDKIVDFIGDAPIIGHFISFDTDFLKAKGIRLKNPLYDTSELARIFMPGLPSYSLEILSEILQIQHKEKHRALDDSIAAQELFFKIIDQIKALDPDLLKEIQEQSAKSTWHFSEVLQTIKSDDKILEFTPPPREKQEISQTEQTAVELTKSSSKTSLIETPTISTQLAEELATTSEKNTVILCPYDIFAEVQPNPDKKIAKLSASENYISLPRLEELKKRENFNTPQITSLIKTLIWLKKTDSGLLAEEISFSQDEREILKHVTLGPDTPPKEEKKSKTILGSYAYTPQKNTKHLIILDAPKFIKDTQYKKSKIILEKKTLSPIESLLHIATQDLLDEPKKTLQELKEKIEVLFGLLENIAESNFKPNDYYPQFELSNFETASPNWARAKDVIKNLISLSQDLKDFVNEKTIPYLQDWKEILRDFYETIVEPDTTKHSIFFQRNRTDELVIRTIPISIIPHFEAISKNVKKITLIGKSLDAQDDCRLIKTLFGLPEDTPLHQTNPPKSTIDKTNLFIVTDIVGNANEVLQQTIEFTKNFVTKNKGRSTIIMNSIKKLEDLHLALAPKLKKNGIILLSQKGSGGLGKILEMYKSDPDSSNIVITPSRWENFNPQDLTEENDFQNLIIQSIPFDPPSDPFLNALAKNFSDPWNEFQIPRAMLSLKQIINKFLTKTPGRIILLDNRVITKSYAKPFIKALAEIKNPEEVQKDDLL